MKVIFRADGNTATGLGHIMRSAAIIQILQPHFECEFWTKNPEYVPLSDFTHAPLIVEFNHDDVLNEAHILSNSLSSDDVILLLDGYKFNTEYQRIIKKVGVKLVCIDDIIHYHFLADVIINHAGGINRQSYSCEPYTNIFLGPEYALVKPLFYSKARPERNLSEEKIFISLGAADPKNDTDKVLQKLIRLSRFEKIHIIIGAANQNFKELQLKYADHTSCFFK
jgi:spore coat polysaccharide biosynthesis predicted glycosyltransferase SpsG